LKWIGYAPSVKNRVSAPGEIEWAPKGGAVVPVSVLFADVRGYTSLTEGISPAEVPALMNRFYETASSALLARGGLLGQVEGDNVMGLYVPGWPERSTGARRSRAGAPCCG